MSLPLYAVYGVSGCGRGIMPLAREAVVAAGLSPERLVFIDDSPASASMTAVIAVVVLGLMMTMRMEAPGDRCGLGCDATQAPS